MGCLFHGGLVMHYSCIKGFLTSSLRSRSGFTSGDYTWLPVSDEYKTNNALQQLRAPQSHLQIFKTLVRVRQEPSFRFGELKIQALDDDVIVYSR